jgi:uncharacterized protein
MSARNKEIVQKVNAAFAANNVEGFLAFCADDVTWTMVGDRTVKGKDEIRKWMASVGGYEAPQFTVDNVIAEGDVVIAHGDMTMKEDGKVVPYSYCDLYRFRGDKIADLRAFVIKTSQTAAAT